MTRRLKLTLSYDGARYAGWQTQPGQRTIQGELEHALRQIFSGVEDRPLRVVGSGRTDAGVHALGQVAATSCESAIPAATILRAINAHLADDIVVHAVEDVAIEFHPIRDAVAKRYRYVIDDGPSPHVFLRRYTWPLRHALDESAMQEGALHLVGRHDFASFESKGAPRQSTVRTVSECSVRRVPVEGIFAANRPNAEGATSALVVVEIEADGFLYNMVRAIVGSLVEVGRRAKTPDWIEKVRTACDRNAAGPTAPAQGLFLVRVDYPPALADGSPRDGDGSR